MIRKSLAASALAVALAGCTPVGKDGFAPGVAEGGDDISHLTIGHRMMEGGEYELALKSYNRAAGQKGFTPEVLSSLGTVNLKLGRLNQSEKLLKRAVEKDQQYGAAWNNLGVVYAEQNKTEEAFQAFHMAFALDNGQSEEVWRNFLLATDNRNNARANTPERKSDFRLVRRGNGRYLLIGGPPKK